MQFALSVVNSGCYEDDDDGGEITKYTGLPLNFHLAYSHYYPLKTNM